MARDTLFQFISNVRSTVTFEWNIQKYHIHTEFVCDMFCWSVPVTNIQWFLTPRFFQRIDATFHLLFVLVSCQIETKSYIWMLSLNLTLIECNNLTTILCHAHTYTSRLIQFSIFISFLYFLSLSLSANSSFYLHSEIRKLCDSINRSMWISCSKDLLLKKNLHFNELALFVRLYDFLFYHIIFNCHICGLVIHGVSMWSSLVLTHRRTYFDESRDITDSVSIASNVPCWYNDCQSSTEINFRFTLEPNMRNTEN